MIDPTTAVIFPSAWSNMVPLCDRSCLLTVVLKVRPRHFPEVGFWLTALGSNRIAPQGGLAFDLTAQSTPREHHLTSFRPPILLTPLFREHPVVCVASLDAQITDKILDIPKRNPTLLKLLSHVSLTRTHTASKIAIDSPAAPQCS
jgi:hypothetical protein